MKLIRTIDNYINDKKFSMIYKDNYLDIINYTKIDNFSSSNIVVSHYNDKYSIEGYNLVISKMMEEEILVVGDINRITFIR